MQKKYILTGLTGLAVTSLAFYMGKSRTSGVRAANAGEVLQTNASPRAKASIKNKNYAYLRDLYVYDDRPE